MENDLLNMESLKSDVNTIIQRLVQKIEKLIDKNESKDYSSDEESNYSSQDRRVKSTVLSAIKNIRSIVLSKPKPANLNLWKRKDPSSTHSTRTRTDNSNRPPNLLLNHLTS